MDPSSVLPAELLSKIFHHYLTDRENPVQSFDFSNGLWVLGKVSSSWRRTANSSKSLWSTITITRVFLTCNIRTYAQPLSDRSRVSRQKARTIREKILTEILRRSGRCPLTISISFPLHLQRGEVIPTSDYGPLCTILAKRCHRWQSIEITGHPYLLIGFTYIPSFRLQSLWKLHMMVGDRAILSQILHICSSLVELITFTLYGKYTLGRIEMPALECLIIVEDTGALDCISAPHLQSLKINCNPFTKENIDRGASPVLDFLHHSQCSIHAMEVGGVGTYDDLVAILSQMPSLKSLTCNISFNRAFLTMMKSPSSLLPQLHTLTLRFHDFIPFPHVKFILDVVESRLEGGFLKHVSIHRVGRTSIEMFDERLAAINAASDVTVFLEEVSLEDYKGDVTEDDLP